MTLREERKRQTRQLLLDAALRLASAGGGFAGVSLREVAREAGVVPTAFYRHFQGLNELGLALLDDVFLTLRKIMRDARVSAQGAGDVAIRASVDGFLWYVRAHSEAFEFVARERFGGPPVIRQAIAREMHYFVGELVSDLRLFVPLANMPSDDLEMIAELVVQTVLGLTAEILYLPAGQERREREITERAIKQLRLIFLGALQWQPERGAVRSGKA